MCVATHHTTTTTQNCTTLQPSTSTHTHIDTHTDTLKQKHGQKAQRNHALCISLPAGFTILLYVNCLSFFCSEWYYLCIALHFIVFYYCLCIYLSIYVYIYTCIVVFGILMEFVLYATVIAGTTNTHAPAQYISNCAGMCHDDGDHYVFFILCPWTPLLFFAATKDCIRLNCRHCCCQQFSAVADG